MSGAQLVAESFAGDLFADVLATFDPLPDEPSDWQERALCAQTDPEAFFPEKGGSTKEAKRICSRCPVRAECLDYALAHDERFGVWGGLSERERRHLRRAGLSEQAHREQRRAEHEQAVAEFVASATGAVA
jgi:WhiB family redox-sensing transcriptional regulator